MYLGVFRNITSEQNVFEPIENNVYVIERKNWENLFFGGFTPKNLHFTQKTSIYVTEQKTAEIIKILQKKCIWTSKMTLQSF